MTKELQIGPLHFEYDATTNYLGISNVGVSNDGELYGTAEVRPEDWDAFAEAVKGEKEASGETMTLYACPSDECAYFSMAPGKCRSHPYPCRGMGPPLVKREAVLSDA